MSADFNIKMTVRNARLLRMVREQYGSASEMARRTDLRAQQISALMTMRVSPLRKDGEWTEAAHRIAGFLGADPAEVWPAHLRKQTLSRASSEIEISMDQVAQLIAPEDDPALVIERKDTLDRLLSALSERERRVLEAHMSGAALREVGIEEGVGPERIRQIEAKAIRKMRQKAKTLRLMPASAA